MCSVFVWPIGLATFKMAFKKYAFQIDELFAGMPVVFIKTYAGQLSGCQLVHVQHHTGHRYRLFRWPNGEINNVRLIK